MTELHNLIAKRLADHEKWEGKCSDALVSGDKATAETAFPRMLIAFVEAAYLAVLAEVKPDLALVTSAWLDSALNDGDTVMEVADQWRRQLAAGDGPWLPQAIVEAL